MQPTAWYCPVCKKFDLADVEKPLATPEHIPYRGIDIGECKGKIIPLYPKENAKELTEILKFFEKQISKTFLVPKEFIGKEENI